MVDLRILVPEDVEDVWGLTAGADYRVRLIGDPTPVDAEYRQTRIGRDIVVLWFEVSEPAQPVGGLPSSWTHPWRVAAAALAEIVPLDSAPDPPY